MCISIFSAFYAFVFFTHCGASGLAWLTPYEGQALFFQAWSDLLLENFQGKIAFLLLAVTILVVVLLLTRRRPYDEYQASILTNCLVVSLILTLIAIALFFVMILEEPIWIAGKFMLFVTINWATVVFSNLVYILLCRRK